MNRSPFRPHWFELYASEQLSSTLRPALKYALEVLSVRNPRLLPIAARSDDLFTVLSLLLETSQLSVSCSTLSESFYGLRRARSFAPTSGRGLPTTQIAASVVLVVLVPYAKLKLDGFFSARTGGPLAQLMGGQGSSGGVSLLRRSEVTVGQAAGAQFHTASLRKLAALIRVFADRHRFEERFIYSYPSFNAIYEGAGLLFSVLYLFGYTRYFSPSLALQGIVVRRLTPGELEQSVTGAIRRNEQRAPVAVSAMLSAAKYALGASVFAFRFLEYYYAAESRAPQQSVVVPRAPDTIPVARGIDPRIAASRVDCPLCREVRKNAAACTKSGYVFCYTCIYSHLERHGTCPVTLMPATTDDILRVYDEQGAYS